MLSASITNNIPSSPGVYIFKDTSGKILYIGKAKNLQKRLQQYFSPGSLRKQEMVASATTLDFHITKNESEALYLEDNLIKKNQPYFNNLLKADNSYVYIKITKEDFPQIILTRKKVQDGAIYIGPKHNTQHLKKFLQYLRQVLKYRWCKTTQFKQGKICSDYYFGICKGRCALASNQPNKPIPNKPIPHESNAKHEYDKIIHTITSFFHGNTKPIKTIIKEQIHEASQQNNFERAGKLRDIFLEIDNMTEQQTVVLDQKTTGYILQVRPIGKRRIYIILYFYEGKLIDIIRHQEHQSEKEADEIVFDLQREFGTVYEQKIKSWLFFSTIPLLVKEGVRGRFAAIREFSDQLFQSYIINSSFSENNLMNDLLTTLQTRYQLKKFPYRIECIDISHLSWWRVSGGLSCLLWWIKYPHGYRKYRIRGVWRVTSNEQKDKKPSNSKPVTRNWTDDYESLKELIERRMKGENLPDLLVIDWGKWQLNVIKKIMKESAELKKILQSIDILSLGKGEARNKSKIWLSKNTREQSEQIYSPPGQITNYNKKCETIREIIYSYNNKMFIQEQHIHYDEVDKLLISARDEAHRFANAYRKKQMSKEFK